MINISKYYNEQKKYRYDFENLKVGDFVFDECNRGFGSGGYGYNIGMLVTEITEDEILTISESGKSERWDKNTRKPKQPPTEYYLAAFQSNAT